MEWIQNHWVSIVGTVGALVGGMYVPFLRGMVLKGLKAMISEAVLKKAAVTMVEGLVKSTKNKLDDVWFAEFKKSVEDA
jgi:xanthosine utilization system XapX-like protein|tara:strand:+ start:1005 stop:1241 length:237 start_codon:yes stop_codon:yes gene_type:complete